MTTMMIQLLPKLDRYSRQIYSEQDAVNALYTNPTLDLSKLSLEDVEQFNRASKLLYAGIKLERIANLDCTPEEYHKQNQYNWHMPEEYKNFDIAKWCLKQCNVYIDVFANGNLKSLK